MLECATHSPPHGVLLTCLPLPSCEPQALWPVTCSVLRLEPYPPANQPQENPGWPDCYTTLGAGFPRTGHTLLLGHTQLFQGEIPPPPCPSEISYPFRYDPLISFISGLLIPGSPHPTSQVPPVCQVGGVGQHLPGVLPSHHLEVKQQVPHPANEEAGKSNLDSISWFQAGALAMPTTPANRKMLPHKSPCHPCSRGSGLYGKSLWVKDLEWGGKHTAFWVSVAVAGRSQMITELTWAEQEPAG